MITETIYDNSKYTIVGDVTVTPITVTVPDTKITMAKPELSVTNNVKVTRTRYQHPFYYYSNDTIIGKSLELYGEYTELELEGLRLFIKDRNSVIYDIGANIGYHTSAFARWCDYVFAFEPNKKNLELLRKNLQSQPHATIYDVACSDVEGVATIQDFDINVPGNYGEMYMNVPGQECKTVKIDDLEELYPPDLIKIDVEGHELQVLKGSIKTIHEYKPVIFYEAHGNDLDEIYDMLSAMDYKLYWYPCPNYNPNNYNNNKINVFGGGGVLNILAIHGANIGNLLQVQKNQSWQQAYEVYLNTQK